jgi:hypothetical protein
MSLDLEGSTTKPEAISTRSHTDKITVVTLNSISSRDPNGNGIRVQ